MKKVERQLCGSERRRVPSALVRPAVAAALVIAAACGRPGAASPAFVSDCEQLCATPHRLCGTAEYRRAADYVARRLRECGADTVIVQQFPTLQMRVDRCELLVDRGDESGPRPVPLLPMRPNGIMAPSTGPQGLRGKLVYVGRGTRDELEGLSLEGSIAVMDYNSEGNWVRAVRLGARAVVFVKNGPCRAWHPHHADAIVNVPRYYFEGELGDLEGIDSATVVSHIVWEPVIGRNVYGYFKGTDPVLLLERDEVVLVGANLDTYGEVPHRSPGARGAANCAGLLELAANLDKAPPRRHVMLAFFDNQARGHEGATQLYIALDDDDAHMTVEKRTAYLAEERAFTERLLAAAEQPSLENAASDVSREIITRLKQEASRRAYRLRDEMMELRTEASVLDDSVARHTVQQRVAELDCRKREWNDLRRHLARMRPQDADSARLAVVRAEVVDGIRRRLDELDLEEEALAADRELARLVRDRWLTLHVSLLLGDRTERWGLAIGGDSPFHSSFDKAGLYGRIQRGFTEAIRSLEQSGRALQHFEVASADGSLNDPRLLVAAPYLVHSGEVAGNYGRYNLALATVQEDLRLEGTPDDRLEELDLSRIETQLDEVDAVIRELCSSVHLSVLKGFPDDKWYGAIRFSGGKTKGPNVMATSRGSNVPNVPTAGAVVQQWTEVAPKLLSYRTMKPYAFDPFNVRYSNANGSYLAGPVLRKTRSGFSATFDEYGTVKMAGCESRRGNVHYRQDIYRMQPGYVALPPLMRAGPATVFDARANSRLETKKSFVKTLDGFVYWYCDEDIERVKVFDKNTIACLVNGPPELDEASYKVAEPIGDGFTLDHRLRPPHSAPQSGSDIWRLNESRLKLLRSKGVTERSLEEIHGRSEDLLLQSADEKGGQRREALATSGFMMERVVYGKSRGTLDDLVRAVLVLLALAVPFAFAMERLLIGSPIIFRQIAWFAAFFVITFMVLFFTHPAFGVSAVPIVIFLGFAVVVLSSLVIVILMRKFEAELKRLQGMTGTVHTADVSRFGTVIAAMNMGISTMRRRPLRTTLTAVTVVLLTFTILAFASFSARLGVIRLFVRQPTQYSGALVHNLDWQQLSPDLLDVLAGRWPGADVCPRVWVAPGGSDRSGVLLSRDDGSSPVMLQGVLGIDSTEVAWRDDMRRMLGRPVGPFGETVWMTAAVARLVGVSEGDWVLVGGCRLRVGPLLEAHDVLQVQDMDNSDILPVNFKEMNKGELPKSDAGMGDFDEALLTAQETVSWTTLPVDLSIVVPATIARRLGGSLHAVTVYSSTATDAAELAEELALMLQIPVVGTRPDGVYSHVLGPVVKASGLGTLVFPILLGGMVIFGTMLGSVSDREKEIYSYTALGLAPPHVAGLFFAEAMVYAVVGGMGGYLTSQGLMKFLGYLSQFGLVGVPEMNYSSSNAVVTILLVMATVLVSTIYPALKASKSANPGVLRHWRLPHPEGDRLDITFPFTVSSYDLTGVVSFLKENFDLYADTGLGTFMARDARIGAEDDGSSLSVSAHLALAPFDLGVTESFKLSSVPSKIEGIEQVRIEIERLSGQPRDWYRLNKVLLAELRKQFLIWRSLTPDTMEMYRQRTLSLTAVEGERDAKELGAA